MTSSAYTVFDRLAGPEMAQLEWFGFAPCSLFTLQQGRTWGFPSGSRGKESACSAGDAGDVGSIPGSGRSPGGRRGNPLQYCHLENFMERGAWQAIVHGVTKSQTGLSD